MKLFDIKFKNGRTIQEYGHSEDDIKDFLKRSYSHEGEVQSIKEM
ncbi:hypothetical protein NVP2275O_133 [Vibrio phage 2.275.O._10N.286.54.E11]|nr:hypothetical protein NVP2275O_133 [Vibrio phage 2.275.O._10N.286.54.E11]